VQVGWRVTSSGVEMKAAEKSEIGFQRPEQSARFVLRVTSKRLHMKTAEKSEIGSIPAAWTKFMLSRK
jgi:hypothetical protein